MASILPLPSEDEIVQRRRCPDSDSPRHYEKAHHLQFMMRVVTSRRRLYPGLGSDSSSRRYRDALDCLLRARASLSASTFCWPKKVWAEEETQSLSPAKCARAQARTRSE
eukprot:6180931-Pleurochrysis_carterae.AAC.1